MLIREKDKKLRWQGDRNTKTTRNSTGIDEWIRGGRGDAGNILPVGGKSSPARPRGRGMRASWRRERGREEALKGVKIDSESGGKGDSLHPYCSCK